jgi:predicted transcriptional regulator
MFGPRQQEIIDLLAEGPASLEALIQRQQGQDRNHVMRRVRLLIAAGVVEIIGRPARRDLTGALVRLAEPSQL